MSRTGPPPLATWMLEHCTAGDYSEALAGDLRERYSSGLSDGWYWRQVYAACAFSWSKSLGVRAPLLIFTLLWSTLAPAWKIFIDGIESAPVFDKILLPLGPFWLVPAFAGWLALNSTFIWFGIVVYIASLSVSGKPFPSKKIRQAFLLAPPVFAAVFGVWFFLCCFDWSFSFADQKLATTPLGQIADFRIVADVIRFPYFITLAGVLWNIFPRSQKPFQLLPVDAAPMEASIEVGRHEPVSTANSQTIKRFFSLMVGAGIINAVLVELLLCRVHELHSLGFSRSFLWALFYVAISALAGAAGSWLYWNSPSSRFRKHRPIPFPLFALVCASAWIWIPSTVIFAENSSAMTTVIAVIGTTFLAVGLRDVTFGVFASSVPHPKSVASEKSELFAEFLYRAPREMYGYGITFLLYAGVGALVIRLNYISAALCALSTFLFVWKKISLPNENFVRKQEYRRAVSRLACVVIPAILVTAWALLDGVAQRKRIEEMNIAGSIHHGASTKGNETHKTESESAPSRPGGYESLILWPLPQKKQIIPPLPERSLLAPGTQQPLIIPFDGQYWYMQLPQKTPGLTARQTHGTPLGHEIASINSTPLVMDAHQTLGVPIPIARCREIQVEIENRDNRRGVIALAVLLTDAVSPKNRTLYLGQQSIVSTEPEHFSYKSGSVFETLRFSIPATAKIRRFNDITVMMLPDVEHSLIAPKIAIKQFQIFPR